MFSLLTIALAYTPIGGEERTHVLRLDYPGTGMTSDGNIDQLPVLVKLTPETFDYDAADVDGHDLIFKRTNQAGVEAAEQLNHEVDTWNHNGESFVWVSYPNNRTDQAISILAYYGAPGATDLSNPAAVWPVDPYRAILHMGDTNEANGRRNVTLRRTDGNTPDQIFHGPGPIGEAGLFTNGHYLELNDQGQFNMDELTLSTWVRRDAWASEDDDSQWMALITKGDDAWRLHRRSYEDVFTFSFTENNDTQNNPPVTEVVPADTWVLLHARYDDTSNDDVRFYVNGVEVYRGNAEGDINNNGDNVMIGNNADHLDRVFLGQLDEVRIQSTPRPDHWIYADAASQMDTFFGKRCSYTDESGSVVALDLDDDGLGCDIDCDDTDPGIGLLYEDLDGDGFGDVETCDAVSLVAVGGDCNDDDEAINPDADEVCDGVDNDCDDLEDDADDTILYEPENEYYVDVDQDGFGAGDLQFACEVPADASEFGTDCMDEVFAVNPGADEICNGGLDDDCNGDADEDDAGLLEGELTAYFLDGDDDGFGAGTELTACSPPAQSSPRGDDCEDEDPDINPGVDEICNGGIDDDCDTFADDDDGNTVFGPADAHYADGDGDGFGDGPQESACVLPQGRARTDGDCDDENPNANPDAVEICNGGIDDDCDMFADDDDGNTVFGPDDDYYADADADGFGDGPAQSACVLPDNTSRVADDCDDQNPDINPLATEVCGNGDEDCDGDIDEADADLDLTTRTGFFLDLDQDGSPGTLEMFACDPPDDSFDQGDDCEDDDPAINPGADEICDQIDNNCNNLIDNADNELIGAVALYVDSDQDGFGDASIADTADIFEGCPGTSGFSTNSEDCDDLDDEINPDAIELCDDVDNDCNDIVDDEIVYRDLWPDVDEDGFGSNTAEPINSCLPAEDDQSETNDDCDDFDADVNPDQEDIPNNGVDEDCDGEDTVTDTDPPPDTDTGMVPPTDTNTDTDDMTNSLSDTGCQCDSGRGGLPWLGLFGVGLLVQRRRR